MFKKGDIVRLEGFEKSYEVMVNSHEGKAYFKGMIIKSEFTDDPDLCVGEFDGGFITKHFKLVEKENAI